MAGDGRGVSGRGIPGWFVIKESFRFGIRFGLDVLKKVTQCRQIPRRRSPKIPREKEVPVNSYVSWCLQQWCVVVMKMLSPIEVFVAAVWQEEERKYGRERDKEEMTIHEKEGVPKEMSNEFILVDRLRYRCQPHLERRKTPRWKAILLSFLAQFWFSYRDCGQDSRTRPLFLEESYWRQRKEYGATLFWSETRETDKETKWGTGFGGARGQSEHTTEARILRWRFWACAVFDCLAEEDEKDEKEDAGTEGFEKSLGRKGSL
jgi:hypothetical protein